MTAIAVATVVVVARISMCVCVAILRDNYGVDIYDAPGQVKQFLQPNHAKSQTSSQKQHQTTTKSQSVIEMVESKDCRVPMMYNLTQKLCIPPIDIQMWIPDDLLTPFFDNRGLHTTTTMIPLVFCFCYEITARVHCHLHLDDGEHDYDSVKNSGSFCDGNGCCRHGIHEVNEGGCRDGHGGTDGFYHNESSCRA